MFYKYDNNGLYYGSQVQSGLYSLFESEKDTYELPIEGWYWFDTIEEAQFFFKIPQVVEENTTTLLNS
jgi:hypothetical protein